PREFDDVYRAVVAAGEQSGALGPVLERMADDLEARQELKGKVVGAMLYPAIVSLIAIVIVIALLTYVVPQVAGVYAGGKRTLPFLTVAMLALSDFVRQWGWLVALAAGAGGVMLAWSLRNEAFRERFDAFWLKLPLVGRLSRGYNAARFAGPTGLVQHEVGGNACDGCQRGGLGQKVTRASLHRVDGNVDFAMPGHDNDLRLRGLALEPAKKVKPVVAAKPDSQKHKARMSALGHGLGTSAVHRIAHREAPPFHERYDGPCQNLFVIHHQTIRHTALFP
ncbi:MAG: hypothetical protein HC783_13335, partial [Rhodobacteraceae bacterium]|nr:hypothetical protein [Paracoccaceae bacterium]